MISVAPGDSETRCFGAAVRLTVFPSLRGSCTGNVSFEDTSGVISPLVDGVAVLLLDPPPPHALIASANVAMKARKIRGRGLRFMHPPAVVLARGIRAIACRKKNPLPEDRGRTSRARCPRLFLEGLRQVRGGRPGSPRRESRDTVAGQRRLRTGFAASSHDLQLCPQPNRPTPPPSSSFTCIPSPIPSP